MLVRRWIQTPSVAKVRSAVQLEGEVVLGASPPARRPYLEWEDAPLFGAPFRVGTLSLSKEGGGPVGLKTAVRAKPVRPLVVSASADDAARRPPTAERPFDSLLESVAVDVDVDGNRPEDIEGEDDECLDEEEKQPPLDLLDKTAAAYRNGRGHRWRIVMSSSSFRQPS